MTERLREALEELAVEFGKLPRETWMGSTVAACIRKALAATPPVAERGEWQTVPVEPREVERLLKDAKDCLIFGDPEREHPQVAAVIRRIDAALSAPSPAQTKGEKE